MCLLLLKNFFVPVIHFFLIVDDEMRLRSQHCSGTQSGFKWRADDLVLLASPLVTPLPVRELQRPAPHFLRSPKLGNKM